MSQNFGRAPGVYDSEYDLTITTSSVSTTEAAIVGLFHWGPVDQRVLVNNETVYSSVFGPPSNFNAETWFSGSNFLDYSDALYVARAANTAGSANDIINTVTSAIATTSNNVANTVVLSSIVKNDNSFDGMSFDPLVSYVARYPGERGNSLRIDTCASAEAYSSEIILLANTDVDVANTAVAYTPGSADAVVTINASANGNANTVTAVANTVVASLNVGDIVTIGNTTTGTQQLAIATIGVPAISGNTATVNITFTSAVTLFEPVAEKTIKRAWEFYNLFDGAPGVSLFQASSTNPTVNDEIHVVVVDKGGKFTGIPGSVLEVFPGVSRSTDAKLDNGQTNYMKNVINQTSRYVWFANGPSGISFAPSATLAPIVQPKPASLVFARGQDGLSEETVPVGVLAKGWDLFASKDDVNIAYFIQGKARGNTLANYIISLAETRGDVLPAISAPSTAVVNKPGSEAANLVAFRKSLSSSSYGTLDGNFKYQYDKYNDVYRWIPLCGDIAGIMARSASGTAPWMSPGGNTRGRIKNVIRLAWQPSSAERDVIYRADINPVYNVGNQGPVLMGDKTLIGKNSAFSRINVRQLFILLRKNISQSAADLLFELNDDFTRAQFRNMNDPLLRDIQGRRGITSYRIVCDETNNTPQVIDNNGFAGDIYVSPARSINTIQLNFVATRTGVDFAEVVGNF